MNDNELMSVVHNCIIEDRISLLSMLLKEMERTYNDNDTEIKAIIKSYFHIKRLIKRLLVKETSDLVAFF